MADNYPLRARDVARAYQVSEDTVRRWVKEGLLPDEYAYVRLPSGRLYFRRRVIMHDQPGY